MNYYPFHVGDYASHTRHLTLMGDLAFRRLLDLYYVSEKPLPLDPAECARLIGMRDHINDVSEVLSDFFLKSEEGWRSKRADEEILAYRAKAERAKAANLRRWEGKKSDLDLKSDADRVPTNNQEPITNIDTPRKRSVLFKPEGVSDRVWTDFLAVRKTKKAALTETALSGIQREAEKARLTLEQALQTCCERGWQSFKADWVNGATNTEKPSIWAGAL